MEIGRLAFRVEGEWWNAYWSPSQTSMDGALHLGAIRFNLAQNQKVKKAFMDTMQEAFSATVAEFTDQNTKWSSPTVAPEHERAGRA